MHLVASVSPFVCQFATKSNKSHYQSKVFVCVSVDCNQQAYTDNSADAVDQLLLRWKNYTMTL